MQLVAQMEVQSRNALMKAQEAEIDKAYKDKQLGISQKNLEREELAMQMKLREAADAFDRQQSWQTDYPKLIQEGIASGLSQADAEVAAARRLTLRGGPTASGFPTAMTQPKGEDVRMFNPVVSQDVFGRPVREKMTGPEFQKFFVGVPDELRTNTVNQAISQIVGSPQSSTGTNAAPRIRRWNRTTGKFE